MIPSYNGFMAHKYQYTGPTMNLSNGLFFVRRGVFNQEQGIFMELYLPALKSYTLYGSSNMNVKITADQGIVFQLAKSSPATEISVQYTFTAANLAALGLVIIANMPFSICCGINLATPQQEWLFVNGINLLSDSTNYTRLISSTSGVYVVSNWQLIGATGNSYTPAVDSGFIVASFSGLNASRFVSVAQFFKRHLDHWNGGRGVRRLLARELSGIFIGHLLFDKKYAPAGVYTDALPGTGGGLINQPFPSIPAAGMPSFIGQRQGRAWKVPAPVAQPTALAEYLFPPTANGPGCFNTIKGNRTGVFSQYDGTTDMPVHLTSLDISGNSWGSTVAPVTSGVPTPACTTVSVITNSRLLGDVTGFNGSGQTPAGFDELHLEIGINNHGRITLDTSRKSRVYLTLANGVATTTSKSMSCSFNPFLDQDIATLWNWATVRFERVNLESNSKMYGVIPYPADNMTSLYMPYNPLIGGFPANFNNLTTIAIAGSKCYGVFIGNKLNVIYNQNIATNSNAPAGSDYMDYDFSNSTSGSIGGNLTNGKIRQLKWPTLTTTTINFSLDANHTLVWTDLPATTTITTFSVVDCAPALANVIFQWGTRIVASTNSWYANGMSSAVVEANFEKFLVDYPTTGIYVNNSLKAIYSHLGTNGAINGDLTSINRPTMIADLLAKAVQYNWFFSTRIAGTYRVLQKATIDRAGVPNPTTGVPTIGIAASAGLYPVNLGATLTLANCADPYYNGDWIIRSRPAATGGTTYTYGAGTYNSNLYMLEWAGIPPWKTYQNVVVSAAANILNQ